MLGRPTPGSSARHELSAKRSRGFGRPPAALAEDAFELAQEVLRLAWAGFGTLRSEHFANRSERFFEALSADGWRRGARSGFGGRALGRVGFAQLKREPEASW